MSVERSYNNNSNVSVNSSLYLIFDLSSIPGTETVTASELQFTYRSTANMSTQLSAFLLRPHPSSDVYEDMGDVAKNSEHLLDVETLRSHDSLQRCDDARCSLSFDVTMAVVQLHHRGTEHWLRLRIDMRPSSTSAVTTVNLQLTEAPTLIVYTHDGLQKALGQPAGSADIHGRRYRRRRRRRRHRKRSPENRLSLIHI